MYHTSKKADPLQLLHQGYQCWSQDIIEHQPVVNSFPSHLASTLFHILDADACVVISDRPAAFHWLHLNQSM